MSAVQIKICGITTLDDALAAAAAGAGWLGFNFYSASPRYLDPLACTRLVSALVSHGVAAKRVGVFVNAPPDIIRTILDDCGLDLAQLSGDEPPEDLAALGDRAFKALRLKGTDDLELASHRFPPRTASPAWLVDAYRSGEYGGTGLTADWALAHDLAARAPIFLAGGLRPENVAAALEQVNPWGVDVASGVEDTPGRKSQEKLAAFSRAVRAYEGRQAV